MTSRAKQVGLLLLAQTGCLAVGLWMQHRYVVSASLQPLEAQAWTEIEAAAETLFSEMSLAVRGTKRSRHDLLAQTALWLADHGPVTGEGMVVDGQWRIISPSTEPNEDATSRSSDPRVEWIQEAPTEGRTSLTMRGKLVLSDGPHIAVIRPLENDSGYIVVHQPVAAIAARADALVSSLPVVSVMTFVWVAALLGVATYMTLARLHDQLDRERSRSASNAIRRTQNLVRTRDAVIFGLAKLAESRDPDTGDHLERISVYSTMLASVLRHDPRYSSLVTPSFFRLIGISSALHDIGKVGVEDRILLKPGPLTSNERASMQTHATTGGECLREIEQRLGGSNFLQLAREITFAHHECWDGSGYPKGLAGTAIPLSARIVAIADMYDALSSRRVYKEPFPHEECVAEIRAEAGRKLDPNLVEVWLTVEPKFRRIACQDRTDLPAYPAVDELAEPAETEGAELCTASSPASGGIV